MLTVDHVYCVVYFDFRGLFQILSGLAYGVDPSRNTCFCWGLHRRLIRTGFGLHQILFKKVSISKSRAINQIYFVWEVVCLCLTC